MQKSDAWHAQPIAGYVSSGESVELVQDGSNLICRQSFGATMLMALMVSMILTCVGLAVTSPEMVRHVRHFQHANTPGKWIAGVVAIVILWLLIVALGFAGKKMFANTQIEVDAYGTVHILGGWKRLPIRVIRPEEMESLMLEQVTFPGKYRTYTSHLLVLMLKSQERLILCASVDRDRLERFRSSIAQRCGLP